MDETLPTYLGSPDPHYHSYQRLWKIKGNENIVVNYALSRQYETLDTLFHRECNTYQNNVAEHCRKPTAIARIASSVDHMIAGILYDTYILSEGIIVLRDIAVLRAWQRSRVGSALLKDIIMYYKKAPPRRDFDIFMCVGNEEFEKQGFLKANGFEPSCDEIEQCACGVDQSLRKRSVAVPCTVKHGSG